MPLALYRNINERSAFAIWYIVEDSADLLQDLPESDRDSGPAKLPRRQAEYAASRLLTQILCQNNKLSYTGINKDAYDKPHLISEEAHISISHSYPFAAAMIHLGEPCGIDIERAQEKIRRISHKFMHNEEEKWVGDSVEGLTVVWSAKETLYKIHGRKKLAFKEDMMVLPRETKDNKSLIGVISSENSEKKYNLGIERIEDFIITFLES
jgi:4'-phosphopantetheinyl transferase